MFDLPFKNVLLLDGSYLLHRSYHSYPYLTSSDGTPTGAVYGALDTIYRYIRQYKPLYIMVALDTVRTCFRNDMYPEYKANRLERDKELQIQFVLLKEFCELANIPCLDADEYEADDLLGSMAHISVKEGFSPFIISGDRDLFQVINDDIKVLYLSKQGLELFGEDEFKEKYGGLVPSQMIELKGLQGDSGDNIPGVKGIGEKTAIKLLQEYSSIDSLYEHVEDLKGKMKEKILNDKDNAYLSRELATIKTDIALTFPDRSVYNIDSQQVYDFLHRLDITSL